MRSLCSLRCQVAGEHLGGLIAPPVRAGSARLSSGAAWFVALMFSLWWDVASFAVLLAVVAAIAARQSARSLGADQLFSSLLAGLGPLAAAVSGRAAGAVLIGAVVVSALLAWFVPRGGKAPSRGIAAWGTAVTAWLPAFAATTALVLTAQRELGAAVAFCVAAGLYDSGVYLIGVDARRSSSGVLAGCLGALAVMFSAVQLAIPPFEPANGWRFAILLVASLPLGAAVARWLSLGEGWAVRRLDVWMVAAPVWAWAVAAAVG